MWPDEELNKELQKQGVIFAAEIPTEPNPVVSFILSWVMPILMFVIIGAIMSRIMGKRMGGNAMTFGKSNAKIYVESTTGIKFTDVAGE